MKNIILVNKIGGYNIINEKANKPFKNIINDREKKEETGDIILSFLMEQNLINCKKELSHLMIEFGYLLQDNYNDVSALVKVVTANKNKTFFIAYQECKLMLLGNGFDDILFRKISFDMLKMYNVDIVNLNKKDYFMELY